ncbi:MAG: smalltalk protein [Bacteroidaceae bacterium]|nr:smalltalk protein [Bacteroidaceae bacterium]
MKNKEIWKAVIQLFISILTAALTAMGTSACMGHVAF